MVPHVEKLLIHSWVVVQFGKEASQTRDYCVAKNRSRSLRAGCDTSRGSPRFPRQARDMLFAAQKALAQDDNHYRSAAAVDWAGSAGLELEQVSNAGGNYAVDNADLRRSLLEL